LTVGLIRVKHNISIALLNVHARDRRAEFMATLLDMVSARCTVDSRVRLVNVATVQRILSGIRLPLIRLVGSNLIIQLLCLSVLEQQTVLCLIICHEAFSITRCKQTFSRFSKNINLFLLHHFLFYFNRYRSNIICAALVRRVVHAARGDRQ